MAGQMPPTFQLKAGAPVQLTKDKTGKKKKTKLNRKRKAGTMERGTPETSATRPKPKAKRRKKSSKAEVRDYARLVLKARIPQLLKNKMTPQFRSHTAQVYAGTDVQEVDPIKKMQVNRALTRHLSTIFLQYDKSMEEVQAAINNQRQEIYISSNRLSKKAPNPNNRTLGEFLQHTRTASQQNPNLISGDREQRHFDRIMGNQRDDLAPTPYDPSAYHNYRLIYVKGLAGKHAETNIVDGVHPTTGTAFEFDFIAGTRRPCVACFIHMLLSDVSQDKFNPHHGSYWNTNNALHSFTEQIFQHYTQIHAVDPETEMESAVDFALEMMEFDHAFDAVSRTFYQTRGYSGQTALNYDTDSEYEVEENAEVKKPQKNSSGAASFDLGDVGDEEQVEYEDDPFESGDFSYEPSSQDFGSMGDTFDPIIHFEEYKGLYSQAPLHIQRRYDQQGS